MTIKIRRKAKGRAPSEAASDHLELDTGVRPVDRLRLLKVAQEELRLAKMRGELVEREKVLEAWAGRVQLVREALLNLRFKLPPLLVDQEERQMSSVIDEEVRALMEQFAAGEAGGALEHD